MRIRGQVLASEPESVSDGTRVGLLSLAYAALDDQASRAEILEASLLASRTETI